MENFSEDIEKLNNQEEIEKEELMDSLPKAKGWLRSGFTLYQGFWLPSNILPNVINFQNHFKPRDTDILLASLPKTGITWLKSLVFSIVNRTNFKPSQSPLLTKNPHELVSFLEFFLYANNQLPNLDSIIHTPRIFSTHIPYPSLPDSIKESPCRVVYICRNPFDTMVSQWHFGLQIQAPPKDRPEWSMEEYFDSYCSGRCEFGPFWEHMLGFWKESLEKPHKVLFLKYEELKEDTSFHLKRLAEFLGCPFSLEEEKDGLIEDILRLCSFNNLKDLVVNKSGQFQANIYDNKSYFRKGEVGDWVNYLSPSVEQRLDNIVKEKLNPHGLAFEIN